MKIVGVNTYLVKVPFEAPIRWAYGVRTSTTRVIVRLKADNGLEGLGETRGNSIVQGLIETLSADIANEDPFNIEKILSRFETTPFFHGYNGYSAIAGIEMALWDLIGRYLEKPLYSLLGGLVRSDIPICGYVFYRYKNKNGGGGESSPADVAHFSRELIEEYGFTTLKLKAGVFEPKHDIETISRLRAELGNEISLRIDPNGVWTPQTSLLIGRRLLEYNLQYLEDPTLGIEPMSRVRCDLAIPFATNMCVVDFDQIPLAIKERAVDIILGDPHKWGGILRTKELAAICRTFGLGFSLHSGAELGISTAAYLHISATCTNLNYAIDSHYHHLRDDIILNGKIPINRGSMAVPSGPGLGVSLDNEKLEAYSSSSSEEISLNTYDTNRPGWYPSIQKW